MLPLGAATSFRLFVAPSGSGSLWVGDNIDPLRVGESLGIIVVVPVPPLVRRGLRIAFRRVLPRLLTPERRHVEVAPCSAHCLVSAAIDEICAKQPPAIANECVVAMPFIDPEVGV